MAENREQLRQRLKMLARRWTFPGSDWERKQIAEIKQLPEYRIARWTDEQLAWSGMPAQRCHANCRWYAANDPDGLSRHVTGWWRQDDVYVLHSVIEREGRMMCLTPGPVDRDERIAFIPDAALSWVDGETYRHCYRIGAEVDFGLRENPEKVIARSQQAIKRLNSGGDPMQAMMRDD